MPTVTSADGTRIAYERHGEGPPLVLLHGDSTGGQYWARIAPRFADDHTVLVPDRRGRGDSGDREAYGLEREIADARAVIDAVEGEPVLFGHSFGGLQAIEVAREVPVRAVVAYEPAVLVGEYREGADLAARMQERLDAGERREAMKLHVEEVIHGGDADDLDAWLEEWPVWPEYVRFVENAVRMNRALEAYELPGSLDLGAPALLLTESDGPPHLRESVRAVHESLAASRLVEFDGLGHTGPSEDPGRVVAEIRAFLDDVRAPERRA